MAVAMDHDSDYCEIIERPPDWDNLPQVVKERAIQFCTKRSRINLALCSSQNNKCLRIFNRVRPISLEIKEFDKIVCVVYKYNDKRRMPKTINAKFIDKGFKTHADKTRTPLYSLKITCVGSKKWAHEEEHELKQYNGSMMNALAKFLHRQFAHVEANHWTFKISILMIKWPVELACFLSRCKDCEWTIQMNNAIYWPYMRLMENHPQGKPLKLLKHEDRDKLLSWPSNIQIFIPKEFFESQLFKGTKKFHCLSLTTKMTDSQFLENNFDSLLINSGSVSLSAVFSKIRRLIAENSKTFEKFVIRTLEDSSRQDFVKYFKNFDLVFKDLSFEKDIFNTFYRTMEDGTFARLTFLLLTGGISFEMNLKKKE